MAAWTQCSRIYGISTWVWLYELSRRDRRRLAYEVVASATTRRPHRALGYLAPAQSLVHLRTDQRVGVKVPKRWPNIYGLVNEATGASPYRRSPRRRSPA
jgi:hypothetical protein